MTIWRVSNIIENKELFAILGNNPQYNIESINELIVTFVTINSQLPNNLREEFFTKFGNIWKSGPYRETLIALCRLRAATQTQVRNISGVPLQSTSRAIKYLHGQGLITPASKIRSVKTKGGPKPIIWAILDYNEEDIIKSQQDHIEKSSPIFSEVERFTQFILDEYLALKPDWMRKKIKIREIQNVIRQNTTNYQFTDVIKLVALQLTHEHEVEVTW